MAMPQLSKRRWPLGVVTVFALWLLATLVFAYPNFEVAAQPQTNAQTPVQPETNAQTPAQNEQPKGTAQAPFFVELLPTPKFAQENLQEGQEHSENSTLERRLANWTVVLAIATVGLIIATLVLGVIGYLELRNNEKTIKASVDLAQSAITANQISVVNTEQQLRAYVTALDVHTVFHRRPGSLNPYGGEIPGPAHTYEFAVILKNGGQTPAINVRTNLNLRRFEGEVPNDFDFPSFNLLGYGLIGPQLEWRTRYQSASAGLIEDIGPALLLWGWVEYDDIFTASGSTGRHRTEFCFRMDRKRLPVTNEFWMGFIPYEKFNAADFDCLRPIDPATGEGGG